MTSRKAVSPMNQQHGQPRLAIAPGQRGAAEQCEDRNDCDRHVLSTDDAEADDFIKPPR